MTENNPWLALGTYEEKDKDKFKGREQDTQNMLKMLQQNEYVVCYAASGDGKSSLINAGVCPEMRKVGYYPIKIVFSTDEYEGINISRKEDGKIDFDAYILRKIEELINLTNRRINKSESQIIFEVDDQFASFPSDLSSILWWKLRTQTIQMPHGEFDYIPVLIFDQFEEILRARWKNEFFEWLETLSSDECPDAIYSSVSDYEKLPSRKKFKAIFSMRYEYVGELDYWTSQRYFIPQMMRGRYFLKPFTIEQAELIIKAHQSDDVASQQLSINANNIASNLADTDNNVSAIMLSLLSYILYDQWSQDKDYEFTPQNVARLMFTHYENILSRCKISDKERNALESALISSNGARRRMPLSDERLSIFAVNAGNSKIEDLVKEHILRQNDDYIELVHDRLVEAIYEGIKKRKEEELILRKKKIKNRILHALLFCAILGLIGWVLYYSLAKVQYVERISGDYSDTNRLCKDTLYIESNSIIRERCFSKNISVKNVVIKGENVFIEEKAFYGCDNLNSLHIIANDCYIDKDAFSRTKISEIVAEGTNIHIEPWYAYVDTIYRLHVKGNGNVINIPDGKYGQYKKIQIFDVEGTRNTIGFRSKGFHVGYLRLVNAEQLYWDTIQSFYYPSEITIDVDDLDILKGTSFAINSDSNGYLKVKNLFLQDKSKFNRINDTTIGATPIVIFKKEVLNERNLENYIDSTRAISPKDNIGYPVSVDEFMRASTVERTELCNNARSFHGYNDSSFAYGNVIYTFSRNSNHNSADIARSAEIIKLFGRGLSSSFSSGTKDIYIFEPLYVQNIHCESRTTRVHVPYGYGNYCRYNVSNYHDCYIVEMSVFETIYERLSFFAISNYHVFPVQFYCFILFVLVAICRIVYDAKWKKNEKQALRLALILLSFILIGALINFDVPIKDTFGKSEIWDIILAIGLLLLVLGIIIWFVYECKRAKKYAIIFGSDESKKAAFSILDKIYKEGGKEDDVFLVSNYKTDWVKPKHGWTENTIVLLTEEELLDKDSEYVKFLSHLKATTTGYIRPIVLGVASNQDIVWPRELRKFGRRYNLWLFKAIAFQSKNLRETDLDEVYRYITKRWDKRIIKSRLLVYVIIGVVFFGLYEIGIIWNAPII